MAPGASSIVVPAAISVYRLTPGVLSPPVSTTSATAVAWPSSVAWAPAVAWPSAIFPDPTNAARPTSSSAAITVRVTSLPSRAVALTG